MLKTLFPPKIISAPKSLFNPVVQMKAQQDIERAFARVFSTDDGRAVLAHLQVMTFARAHGPDAPDQSLRYAEGQRALVANILRLIDRGRG